MIDPTQAPTPKGTRGRDLGWLATVTAFCDSHQENETWGVKGDTAAEARDRIALAQEGIMGDHRLRRYIPQVGKIYPLPIRPPEPNPIEEAAAAIAGQLKDLSQHDRLQVLRRAIKGEEDGEGLVPIPPCDGGQIP